MSQQAITAESVSGQSARDWPSVFVRENITEIAGDVALRLFGSSLSLVNLVTFLYWIFVQPVYRVLAPTSSAICWPAVPRCGSLRVLSQEDLYFAIVIASVASVLNALWFMRGEVRRGYWWLATISAVKGLIVMMDFRLALNQHYMYFWIAFAYLFVPRKRVCIGVLLVSFYVWAGLLKISPGSGWLTGGGLYGRKPLGLPAAWVGAECLYVVALELIVAFGLMARNRWIFWSSIAQFYLFHIASFWVVGFFYPIEMFLLLSFMPLNRLFKLTAPSLSVRTGFISSSVPWMFGAAQLIPHLFPGNPSITGEGRMFALNMFDAPVECHATAERLIGGQSAPRAAITIPFLEARLACDPMLYWSFATSYCESPRRPPGGDLNLYLESRPAGSSDFRPIVQIDHFCSRKPQYHVLRHNDWIQH